MHSQVDGRGFRKYYVSSSALQFPGMSQCPMTQITVTLQRLERRLSQRQYFLTILELLSTFDRDFVAAWLSEKIENIILLSCIFFSCFLVFFSRIVLYYRFCQTSGHMYRSVCIAEVSVKNHSRVYSFSQMYNAFNQLFRS